MPFKRGQSGNPGGRALGMERLIKQRTGGQGEAMVELYESVLRGDVSFTKAQTRVIERIAQANPDKLPEVVLLLEKLNMPTIKERMDAGAWLAAHAWGKPRESVEITGLNGGPVELTAARYAKLTIEELSTLRDLEAKALTDGDDDGPATGLAAPLDDENDETVPGVPPDEENAP